MCTQSNEISSVLNKTLYLCYALFNFGLYFGWSGKNNNKNGKCKKSFENWSSWITLLDKKTEGVMNPFLLLLPDTK